MRALTPLDHLGLLHLLTLSLAIPALPFPLAPRGKAVCANYPNVIAGTHTPSLTPRTPTNHDTAGVLWCAPGSSTYIIVTLERVLLHPPAVQSLLATCYNTVLASIVSSGDGLIPSGVFSWPREASDGTLGVGDLALHVWNTNNHQVTWGVLAAALIGLQDYLSLRAMWAEASFSVYDGGTEVGMGIMGVTGH